MSAGIKTALQDRLKASLELQEAISIATKKHEELVEAMEAANSCYHTLFNEVKRSRKRLMELRSKAGQK